MTIRSMSSQYSASFPIYPDMPNRRPTVYNSKYPIASTNGRGTRDALAHLAIIDGIFGRMLQASPLDINQIIHSLRTSMGKMIYRYVGHARPAFPHVKCCKFRPTFPNDLYGLCMASMHHIKSYKYLPNTNWKIEKRIYECAFAPMAIECFNSR